MLHDVGVAVEKRCRQTVCVVELEVVVIHEVVVPLPQVRTQLLVAVGRFQQRFRLPRESAHAEHERFSQHQTGRCWQVAQLAGQGVAVFAGRDGFIAVSRLFQIAQFHPGVQGLCLVFRLCGQLLELLGFLVFWGFIDIAFQQAFVEHVEQRVEVFGWCGGRDEQQRQSEKPVEMCAFERI